MFGLANTVKSSTNIYSCVFYQVPNIPNIYLTVQLYVYLCLVQVCLRPLDVRRWVVSRRRPVPLLVAQTQSAPQRHPQPPSQVFRRLCGRAGQGKSLVPTSLFLVSRSRIEGTGSFSIPYFTLYDSVTLLPSKTSFTPPIL